MQCQRCFSGCACCVLVLECVEVNQKPWAKKPKKYFLNALVSWQLIRIISALIKRLCWYITFHIAFFCRRRKHRRRSYRQLRRRWPPIRSSFSRMKWRSMRRSRPFTATAILRTGTSRIEQIHEKVDYFAFNFVRLVKNIEVYLFHA